MVSWIISRSVMIQSLWNILLKRFSEISTTTTLGNLDKTKKTCESRETLSDHRFDLIIMRLMPELYFLKLCEKFNSIKSQQLKTG